jgi:hypothetical protein
MEGWVQVRLRQETWDALQRVRRSLGKGVELGLASARVDTTGAIPLDEVVRVLVARDDRRRARVREWRARKRAVRPPRKG